MDEAKRLIINVVTWNSQAYLPGLFASLDEQTFRDFSVSVVDNASDDGTVTWLGRERMEAAALRNFRNQGFARAHNQAIALALSRWGEAPLEERYVMIANPDLEFGPEALERLVGYMDAHPEIAACGPKLLRAYMGEGADEDRRTVDRTSTLDSTGLLMRRSRRCVDRGAGEEDRGQYDGARDVFGISGACLIVRASVLSAVRVAGEVFDEDFFAYKEDVDLAWRMRRLGCESRYVPEAVVWHHRRAPSAPGAGWYRAWRQRARKSPTLNFLSTRNHGWVMVKNDTVGNAFLHAIWWMPYECAKLIASLFSWAQLKGEGASIMGIPAMLRKRKEIAGRAKASGAALRKWFV